MYSEEIINFIKDNNLIEAQDNLIVAVSSGPDSMCLLHFLLYYKNRYKLDNINIYVAHVNHQTRGDENTTEENLLKNYCLINKIPVIVENFHMLSKNNFHQEARNFRYEFFLKLCRKFNGNKIVLAHHQDDQVETVLFRIIRGNTLDGYTGIKAKLEINEQVNVIRPFLNITKQEIMQYCKEYNIPYAIDSSNLESKYTRNYIRNQIIPKIKEIQPDFNKKIIQLKQQLTEVNEYLYQNAKTNYERLIISKDDNKITLDLESLKMVHNSIVRLIILNVINDLTNNSLKISYEKLNQLMNIIHNRKPNITFDLGLDHYCIKEYDLIIFQKQKPIINDYLIYIDEFKEYQLPNNMKISVKIIEEKAKMNNNSLILCYNSTMWPLILRTKNSGDSIKTEIGTKKINRVFIDKKISEYKRKSWPILTDRNNNVLWVIGIQKANIKLNCKSQYVLIDISSYGG